jgi:hypothetical protein
MIKTSPPSLIHVQISIPSAREIIHWIAMYEVLSMHIKLVSPQIKALASSLVAVSVLPFADAVPNTSRASILWLAPKFDKPHKSRRTHKLTL